MIARTLLLMALLAVGADAANPRARMKDGIRQYGSTNFAQAAESFAAAAKAEDADKLDPAVAHYNRGNALFRAGRYDEAAEAFNDATRTENLDLQAKALYNRGTSLLGSAAGLQQQGSLDPAKAAAESALKSFHQSLDIAPADLDAKHNFELAQAVVEAIEQKRQQQKQQQDQGQQDKQKQDEKAKSEDQKQEGKQDQGQQQQQQDSAQQGDDQKQDQAQADQQKQQEQQKGSSDTSSETNSVEEADGEPRESGEMTEEDAKLLLDAMKKDEQAARENIRVNRGRMSPVEKDW